MAQRGPGSFEDFPEAKPLGKHQDTVAQTPDHECPARPVPQPAEEKDDEEIEIGSGQGRAAAAEGKIKIVAKPGGQRDMPACPVLAERSRYVRIVEILGKAEAEHPAQPDGHVGVSGEIEIDLQCEANGAQPCSRGSEPDGWDGEYPVSDGGDVIGDDYLFGRSDDEAPDTISEIFEIDMAFHKLGRNLLVADDRACDQLGEHCHEAGEVHETARGCSFAPVDVDGVAHRLEGIETDSEGKNHSEERCWHRQAERSSCGDEIVGEKVEVFEKSKQGQIGDNRKNERRSLAW